MGGIDRRRLSCCRHNDQEPSLGDVATNESDSQTATNENELEEEGCPQRSNRSRRRRNYGSHPEGGSISHDRQPVTVADFIFVPIPRSDRFSQGRRRRSSRCPISRKTELARKKKSKLSPSASEQWRSPGERHLVLPKID